LADHLSKLKFPGLVKYPHKIQTIKQQVQHKIGNILSQLDRDPFSKTAGSFDRLYWGWKLKDYPDATLQRLAYPLTNYYYRNENDICEQETFLGWIIKSFDYTNTIQHSDGSFDQAFPNEHSHGATAFLLFDIARTYQLIRDRLGKETSGSITETMRKMGDYLIAHDEKHGFISNHLSGAAAGLQVLYNITGGDKYENHAKFYISRVLSKQSPEGWYMEYGGADPGYQTLAIYYLANYYLETKDEIVLESLRKAVDFVSYFIHPDGSFGGEYGSRNTEIFYPGGFALLQREIPLAKSVLRFMIDKINRGNTVNLNTIDIGNLAPLLTNYLDVIKCDKEKSSAYQEEIPFCEKPFIKDFKDAGIVIYNGEKNYAVIGISKGGVIKEFDKNICTKLCDDCGYIGKLRTGEMISTQNLSKPDYVLNANDLRIHADFFEIRQSIPDPQKFLLLRFFNLTLGRFHWIRERIKRMLVKTLLTNSKKVNYKLVRTVSFSFPLKVEDHIEPEMSENEFEYLEHGIKFSAIHMASSKYFYHQ
jgi:hypothetical protein